jgi:hypothetical protein
VTGATLTLNGDNFVTAATSATVAVDLYDLDIGVLYACLQPVLLSSSAVTCVLPYMPRLELEGAQYPVRLRFTPYGPQTNWLLAVGYSSSLLPAQCEAATASSDYWTAFVISLIVAVLMSVLAALLASYIARLRKDDCCVKPPLSAQQPSDGDMSSAAVQQAVELENW